MQVEPPDSELSLTIDSLVAHLEFSLAINELLLDLVGQRERGNGVVTTTRYRVQQMRASLLDARRGV